MLALTEDGKLEFANYAVTFFHLNSQQVHYENDKRYWLEMASRWPDLLDLAFNPVVPTAEQTARFNAVVPQVADKAFAERFLAELSNYVQYGAVATETVCPILVPLKETAAAIAGTLTQHKEAALTRLATLRYQAETAGITTANGAVLATTRAHQAQLTSVYTTLKEGFVTELDFKGPAGFQKVTLATLKPLVESVARHVHKTFTAESVVTAQINTAATVEALAAIEIASAFTAAMV